MFRVLRLRQEACSYLASYRRLACRRWGMRAEEGSLRFGDLHGRSLAERARNRPVPDVFRELPVERALPTGGFCAIHCETSPQCIK